MIDLTKIDARSQRIFATFLGAGFAAVCGSVGITLVKSNSFTYSSGQTNINLDRAKEVTRTSNDLEYANKKLREKLDILELDIAIIKDSYRNDRESLEVITYVDEAIQQIDINAQEIEKSTEKLKEVTEEVIEKASEE